MTRKIFTSLLSNKEMRSVLERIRLDCKFCPDCDEKWLWTGNNISAMHRAIVEINGVRYPVRRCMFSIHNPASILTTEMTVTTECENKNCLNPRLLIAIQKSEVIRRMVDRGELHTAQHRAALQRSRRERSDIRLTIEKARAIRDSDKSINELAAEYSVTRQTISAILQGKTWVERNSPFSLAAFGISANQNQARARA